jgi:thioredoxin-like negative regulator of GroEL
MILLFTSDHCMMCDTVKGMLEEEEADLGESATVCEVNVERHPIIAEVYGVMVVPTLVAGGKALYGVPCESELRSFLLQAAVGSSSHEICKDLQSALRSMSQGGRQKAGSGSRVRLITLEPVATNASNPRQTSQRNQHSEKLGDQKEEPNPALQH